MASTDTKRDPLSRVPRLSRRRFLALTAASGGLALLAACGGSVTTPTAATNAPAAAAPTSVPVGVTRTTVGVGQATTGTASAATGRPVSPLAASGGLKDTTITIIIFSGPEADTHTRLGAKFTEYTKGKVKVRVEEGGRGDGYDAKWLSGLQAKTAAWDVLHDNGARFLGSGPAGFFVPLSKFMGNKELFDAAAYNNDDFPQAVRDVFTYNGEQMLVIQEASAVLFAYRKDLLKQYGVPEPPPEGYDWDTYLGHLKTLQDGLKKDGKADVFPLLLGAKKGFHSNLHIVQNGWANGGQIFDKVTPTFDDPKVIEAAQSMLDLLKNKYMSEGVVGYEYPDVLTGFQGGKAATAFQWNAAAPTFLDPNKSPEIAGKIGFSALPYYKALGSKIARFHPSPHGIGVSAYSKNQQEAFAYCAWFTSQEIARDYVVNGGGSSGRTSLLTDKAILEKSPHYLGLSEELKLQHPQPPLEQYNYVYNTILAAHTSSIWTGQEDPKGGLAKAREEAVAYLKQQGVLK